MTMTKELLNSSKGSLVVRFPKEGTDFICCTNYVENNGKGSWDSAEYFEYLDDAMDCFYNRMSRERLTEITKLVISKLIENEQDAAFDYLGETVGLTNFEARELNIALY